MLMVTVRSQNKNIGLDKRLTRWTNIHRWHVRKQSQGLMDWVELVSVLHTNWTHITLNSIFVSLSLSSLLSLSLTTSSVLPIQPYPPHTFVLRSRGIRFSFDSIFCPFDFLVRFNSTLLLHIPHQFPLVLLIGFRNFPCYSQ